MKIAVAIKQVPAKDAPLRIAESGDWIRETDIGFEMNEPDSFALEEGAAPQGKARRRSGGAFHGPRARQADHQGSAGQGRRPRHPRRRRQILPARSAGLGQIAGRRHREGKIRSHPDRLAERRSRLRPDRRPAGRAAGPAARHHHHADRSAGRPHAPQARAGSRLVPVGRAAAAGRAHHSVRHQQGALRLAQGHHGRQEKGNRHGAARVAGARRTKPTQRVERIYVPQKTKKTEFITGTPKEAAAKLLEKLRHEARVLS